MLSKELVELWHEPYVRRIYRKVDPQLVAATVRTRVEEMLDERLVAHGKWDEDGVVYSVWVPFYTYHRVVDKVEQYKDKHCTWNYQGWNLSIADFQWDFDTRPATALNYWDQLGLV